MPGGMVSGGVGGLGGWGVRAAIFGAWLISCDYDTVVDTRARHHEVQEFKHHVKGSLRVTSNNRGT